MYIIRVEFPDEDKYAYVTNDEGEVKRFTTEEIAKKEASKYAGIAIVLEVEDENIHWSGWTL